MQFAVVFFIKFFNQFLPTLIFRKTCMNAQNDIETSVSAANSKIIFKMNKNFSFALKLFLCLPTNIL